MGGLLGDSRSVESGVCVKHSRPYSLRMDFLFLVEQNPTVIEIYWTSTVFFFFFFFSLFWSVFASFTSFWVVGNVAKISSANPKVRGAPSDSLSSPVVGGCWNQRRVTRSTWDLYERAWRYCIESFHPLAHPNRRPTYFFFFFFISYNCFTVRSWEAMQRSWFLAYK